MEDRTITLAHGNGGRFMRELIDEIFAPALANEHLDVHADAVAVPLDRDGEIVVTTDGFTVQPLEFPGGDIGSLAVHGTVNDLSVAGADPRYLTVSAFLEEGTEIELLRRIVSGMADAARAAGVAVVAGDTKVVRRGEGGGVYFAVTGIGVRPSGVRFAADLVREGDCLLVSGPVGDHGTAVMLAREDFGLRGDLRSDAGSVYPLAKAARAIPGVRFLRDPTRGGLATVAHDLARATGRTVRLRETEIPVRDPVRSVCEMLGYDPYYLACEGRVVAAVGPESAERLLAAWRGLPEGAGAAIIGAVVAGAPRVILETVLGGERFLEELEDDPLPRIC